MPKPAIQFRRLGDLKFDPRNARTHSDAQIQEIAVSVRQFGWTSPILADDVIRAGHGRAAAARLIYEAGERICMAPGAAAGGYEIPNGTIPVIDCTGWTEEQRRAYALADNRIAENAGWDFEILQGELDALGGVDFDMAAIGFDEEMLALVAEQAQPAGGGGGSSRTSPDEFPEFGADIKTEHRCPKCNYAWSGKSS